MSSKASLTRRHLFRLGGLFGAGSVLPASDALAAQRRRAATPPAALPDVYRSIGARQRFSGTIAGDSMTRTLDLGEYLTATWTARRART